MECRKDITYSSLPTLPSRVAILCLLDGRASSPSLCAADATGDLCFGTACRQGGTTRLKSGSGHLHIRIASHAVTTFVSFSYLPTEGSWPPKLEQRDAPGQPGSRHTLAP